MNKVAITVKTAAREVGATGGKPLKRLAESALAVRTPLEGDPNSRISPHRLRCKFGFINSLIAEPGLGLLHDPEKGRRTGYGNGVRAGGVREGHPRADYIGRPLQHATAWPTDRDRAAASGNRQLHRRTTARTGKNGERSRANLARAKLVNHREGYVGGVRANQRPCCRSLSDKPSR